MTTNSLSTGTWANVDGDCPLRCKVEGSDLANLMIGDDDHTIELLIDAASMRRLAELSVQAVADMDASFEREDARRAVAAGVERGAKAGRTRVG